MSTGRSSPLVVILAAHWESTTEDGWITRQVAGALACVADVHVITPDDECAGGAMDSVFTLHCLGTPLDTSSELRRDLLMAGVPLHSEGRDAPTPTRFAGLIDGNLTESWSGAIEVMAVLQPDLVLIAGHQHLGALAAVDAWGQSPPVSLLALASPGHSPHFPYFDPIFDRARTVLAVTESEASSIEAYCGPSQKVHRIGAPLAADPNALTEPNTWVGATDYIFVLTAAASEEDHVDNDLSRLLRLRFPSSPVGVANSDVFSVWHQGRCSQGWPIERPSDLARLMAWARVTVDLHPQSLFARRCIDSLLYGTPIVVPSPSRAREHAQRGQGGLWFASPGELILCVEALFESSAHRSLSAQGKRYAEEGYGSTDGFIDRVVDACGLAGSLPVQITA